MNIEHTASLAGLQDPGILITIRQSMDEGMERPIPWGSGLTREGIKRAACDGAFGRRRGATPYALRRAAGVSNQRIIWYKESMRRGTEEEWKKCPFCGRTKSQVRAGYNGSGTQRCKCKECGKYYTVEPKQHAYSEETRKLALKMYYSGVSGRGVGRILSMNKSNVMNWIKKECQNQE